MVVMGWVGGSYGVARIMVVMMVEGSAEGHGDGDMVLMVWLLRSIRAIVLP